jgi:hypothetical protein
MAGNKKPRKKYKPSGLVANVVQFVQNSMTPVALYDSAYTTKWGLQLHSALVDLSQGHGTAESLSTVISAHYVCAAVMHVAKLGVEHKPVLDASAAALRAITERCKGVGAHIPDLAEMEAINLLGELHDAMMQTVTVAEIAKAHNLATIRLRETTKKKLPVI